MRITTREIQGTRVLTCHGTMLLEGGAEELVESFPRALKEPGHGIVLDLTRLNYLDSAGVGAVISCSKQSSAAGVILKIAVAAAGPVRRIFQFTQLERGFEIFDDVDAAAASFK